MWYEIEWLVRLSSSLFEFSIESPILIDDKGGEIYSGISDAELPLGSFAASFEKGSAMLLPRWKILPPGIVIVVWSLEDTIRVLLLWLSSC